MPRNNKIIIRTGTTVPVATDFVTGEPAFNSSTSAFYIKNAAGAMAQIGSGVFTASLGSASAPSLTFTGDTNTGVYSPGADQVSIVTGGVARFTVNASGRSLARANNERYAVGSAYSATSGFVYFGANNESATPDAVISNAGGGALMTLQNGGNVGIGTIAPTVKLDVSHVSTVANETWAGGTDFLRLFAATGSAFSEQAITFQEGSANVGAKIGVKNCGAGAYDIVFANRDNSSTTSAMTERMRIVANGVVGIGVVPDAVTGKGILLLSGGINFPATAALSTDANTLDDYEEGTWTPSLSATTTAPTVTYHSDATTGRFGRYVKVGRVVHIWGRIRLTARTGGSGFAIVTGLPFTVASGTGGVSSPSFYVGLMSGWTTAGPEGGYFNAGATTMTLSSSSATTTAGIPIANAGATADVMWSGTYETDE